MNDKELDKHLGFFPALALAITIVVGSGALILPGLTYQQLGTHSAIAWIISSLITIPLLVIFSRLGAHYPGSGGIAGFVRQAFGNGHSAAMESVLLGTFVLGIPAVALAGGSYISTLPILHGIHPAIAAMGLIWVAGCFIILGNNTSTTVQIVLAAILVIFLTCLGVAGCVWGHYSIAVHGLDQRDAWIHIGNGVGIVFFAFSGWEMISFTTGEYKNPRRDFPRVVIASYCIVVCMYLVIVFGVERTVPRSDEQLATAPLYSIAQTLLPAIAPIISIMGALIIFANLGGALWGASRLTFSSAQQGLLPSSLQKLNSRSSPYRAVLLWLSVCSAILMLHYWGVINFAFLLDIAGKNFFFLYFMCALAYTKIYYAYKCLRIYGIIVASVLASIAIMSFGYLQLGYVGVLYAGGWLLNRFKHARESR